VAFTAVLNFIMLGQDYAPPQTLPLYFFSSNFYFQNPKISNASQCVLRMQCRKKYTEVKERVTTNVGKVLEYNAPLI